jgi:cytochrome d ubiquinol oxidase subunit I
VDLAISLGFFLTVYTTLAVIMVLLMLKIIKAGPSERNVLIDGIRGSAVVPERAAAAPQR